MQQQQQIEEETTQTAPAVVINAEQPLAQTNRSEAASSFTAEQEARLAAQDWLEAIGQRRPLRLDPLVFWIFVTAYLPTIIQILMLPVRMHLSWTWPFNVLLGTVVPLTLTSRIHRMKRETREDQLAEEADVRWIGTLAQALHAPEARKRHAAARQLTRLLPRLKPATAGLLDAQTQDDLCAALRTNSVKDLDLNLAILKALERFGNVEALPAVEFVADTGYWRPTQRFVCKAAQNCLIRMEARLSESRAQNTGKAAEAQATPQRLEERQASPEVEALKRRLKEEQKGQTAPAMRSPFLLFAWATILPACFWKIGDSLNRHDWPTAAAFGAVFGLTTQLPRLVLSFKQKAAAQQLAAYDNIQGIGPLAEALEWPDPAIRALAARSLTRLLPQLNASDAGLLSVNARGCLYRCLKIGNARHEETLLLAILKALEQVGDEAALPYVQRLVDSQPVTRAQIRVRQKAVECLPFLESGASQRRGHDILLRASSMDSAQPEILLRPAASGAITESDQLLRAGIEGKQG